MKNIFARKKIETKKSIGSLLKAARLKKDVSLEKAEEDTKVRYKYLQALEKDDFSKMAPDVYNLGFLRRYCNYLKLDAKELTERYKVERSVHNQMNKNNTGFSGSEEGIIKPGNPEQFRDKLKFIITPQALVSLIVVFVVVGLIGYIWFQVKSFAAAPELDLDNPTEQIAVNEETIKITGKTAPTAILFINQQFVGVGSDGSFSQDVKLVEGINEIEIKAENKANKETIQSVKVLVVGENEDLSFNRN